MKTTRYLNASQALVFFVDQFGFIAGTIVEVLAPGVFEVEFCDLVGNTIGFAELCLHEFLVLRHEAALAA